METNFVATDYKYGQLILNKKCEQQLSHIQSTNGIPHIESELNNIFSIIDKLEDYSIIVDAGANVGLVTLPIAHYAKSKGKNVSVISFEPQRMLFSCLSGSVALNEFYNVWVHNKALSDTNGHVVLPEVDYDKFYDFGLVNVSKDGSVVEHGYMRNRVVDCVTLDSMNLPRLDFLKIDVEGFECNVINGGAETIQKYKPILWIEYFLIGLDTIKTCLDQYGNYEYVVMNPQNVMCIPQKT